ncbi:hypothetical protein GCM10019059_10640 [Camelimonas fluminis]|uniref:Uncharacterized protein n=1 Tax=Camelimonas fluminis TaxID=1576911 RepID=A0ABV7ULM6_9HYPH|nr:hypothetical protein [Camelimonas fluminis]GHE53387.1 hypothetical protein GCM10019059_10640 [Camelimonas fluminis]
MNGIYSNTYDEEIMPVITSNANDENEFLLNLPQGSTLEYISGSFYDGSGDSPDVPISAQDGSGTFTIVVDVDRSGSSDAANSFVDTCGGEDHVFSPFADKNTPRPDKLNFYFGLTVTFGGDVAKTGVVTSKINIYVGEGKQGGGHNNWWMGYTNLNQDGLSYNQANLPVPNSVTCTNVSETLYLAEQLAGSGDVNQYKIRLNGYRTS